MPQSRNAVSRVALGGAGSRLVSSYRAKAEAASLGAPFKFPRTRYPRRLTRR